jgi:hypothetical protein
VSVLKADLVPWSRAAPLTVMGGAGIDAQHFASVIRNDVVPIPTAYFGLSPPRSTVLDGTQIVIEEGCTWICSLFTPGRAPPSSS